MLINYADIFAKHFHSVTRRHSRAVIYHPRFCYVLKTIAGKKRLLEKKIVAGKTYIKRTWKTLKYLSLNISTLMTEIHPVTICWFEGFL